MAQFLDLEAVESGAEEMYSDEMDSNVSDLEVDLGGASANAETVKRQVSRKRPKTTSKKARQEAKNQEEERQHQSVPARGKWSHSPSGFKRVIYRIGQMLAGLIHIGCAHRQGVSGGLVNHGRALAVIGRKSVQKRAKSSHQVSDSDDPAEEQTRSTGGNGGHSKATAMGGRKRSATSHESAEAGTSGTQAKKAFPGKVQPLPETDSEEELEIVVNPAAPNPPEDPITYNAQKAMGMLERICDTLDIKWQGYDIAPDSAIWSKIGGTYMRKKHSDYRLTFSAYDSFHTQIGRFMAAMVYAKSGLEPKFLPGGVFVWRHGWFDQDQEPKCLHGQELVAKPRSIELNPSSEAGKRAIAEQNAAMEKNRYGRQVAVLRFPNNAVCYKDKDHNGFPHPHAHGSCCVVFSDVQKAISAMTHDIEWTLALYPNADKQRARECVLICGSCNCNYATEGPIAGRQLPKMVPYKLSGTDEISRDLCKSRKDMQVHKEHPHTMVFMCCNPQSSGMGTGGGRGAAKNKGDKSCSWKLSAMDLRFAYVVANEIYGAVFGKTTPANLQQFKWSDQYCFKTDVLTPIRPLESQDPFA